MKTDLTYNEAYSQLEKLVIQLEDDGTHYIAVCCTLRCWESVGS